MIVVALAALAAAQAAPTFPKNGAVGLTPPPAMREAASFAGFEDPATEASILIAELPAEAYPQLTARFDEGGILPNGVALTAPPAALTLADGTPARLYRGSQTARGIAYAKWMLIVSGRATTALVTAQAPQAAADRLGPGIEAALRSVVLRDRRSLDEEITALPFTIADRAGFRAVRTLVGSSLILTDGPLDVDPAGAQLLVIVASSLGDMPIADRATTARKLLSDLGGMTDVAIGDEPPSPDNTNYRLTATALDRGKPVTVVQHTRFQPDGGYVRIVCVAPQKKDIAARCDRLAASVTPRPADAH